MRTFYQALLDVCHESLDLAYDELDFRIHNDKFIFSSINSSYQVTIVPDAKNEKLEAVGMHHTASVDFDDYKLSDLILDCVNGGYDYLYIHNGGLK